MLRFNVVRDTAPTFTPVVITLTLDSAADLMLVTNLFGGVPAGATSAEVNSLAEALRTACEASGVAKATRKAAPGFNWGKKLRDCLAEVEG